MLDKPNICIKDIFDKLKDYYKSSRTDKIIRTKISNLQIDNYLREEKSYNNLCELENLSSLNLLQQENYFNDNEMISLYNHLDKIYYNEAITIYDYLMQKDKNLLCQYCNMEVACELDHFLPKSIFYSFAITPLNLVPICSTCNNNQHKFSHYPHHDNKGQIIDYIFHPYYDDINKGEWLKACLQFDVVNSQLSPIFSLTLEKPKEWNDIKFQRLKFHYDILKFKERLIPKMIETFYNYKKTIIQYGKIGNVELERWLRIRFNEINSAPIHTPFRLILQAMLDNLDLLMNYVQKS